SDPGGPGAARMLREGGGNLKSAAKDAPAGFSVDRAEKKAPAAEPPPAPRPAPAAKNGGGGAATARPAAGAQPRNGQFRPREQAADKKDDKPNGKSDAPQVWKRDSKQPTFARVYLGDRNSLELVSLQVTVTLEGPRTRTVVDHIFHNPHDRRLEG